MPMDKSDSIDGKLVHDLEVAQTLVWQPTLFFETRVRTFTGGINSEMIGNFSSLYQFET